MHLILRNLQGNDLQQGISTLLLPLVNNVLVPQSPVQITRQRSFSFKQPTNPSVVVNSIYIRSVYLITAVVKIAYSSNKLVRDVLYSQLIPLLTTVVENLCDCFNDCENGHNYENCRILWNFVLYSVSVLKGHQETHSAFLPIVGNLFTYFPTLLNSVNTSVKAMLCRFECNELM